MKELISERVLRTLSDKVENIKQTTQLQTRQFVSVRKEINKIDFQQCFKDKALMHQVRMTMKMSK